MIGTRAEEKGVIVVSQGAKDKALFCPIWLDGNCFFCLVD